MALVENVRVSSDLVRYRRAGANTVDRVLSDYINNISPVMDYGAVGDGVTDDSAAFAKAVAALPAGSTLDLGNGTYVASVLVNKKLRIQNGRILPSKTSLIEGGLYITANGCVVDNVNTYVDVANLGSYAAANVSGIVGDTVDGLLIMNCDADGSKCNRYDAVSSWGVTIGAFNSSRVVIQNCTTVNSHKEGIMTRFCDRVFMSDCYGYGSGTGFSNIGTSGGDVAYIRGCYSKDSGATGITMNNHTSIVDGCIVEGNKNFQAILIGHNHETQQYAGTCIVTGCVVRNSFLGGITIDKPLRASIVGNIVENVGTGGAANGILVNNPQDATTQILIEGNNVSQCTGSGVYLAQQSGVGCEALIEGNVVRGVSMHGIRVENELYTSVIGNKLRSIGMSGIRVWVQDVLNDRGKHCYIDGNTIEFCSQNSVDVLGQQYLSMKGNTHLGFNQSVNAGLSAVVIRGSDGTNNIELPDTVHVSGDTFLVGNVGSGMHSITITPDGMSTTGKIMSVTGCLFTDTTRDPVTATARYAQHYAGNKRGSDPGLVSVVVPANGSLTVNNSNQTPFAMPAMVGRDSGSLQVVIQTFGTGTMLLRNYNSSTAASMTLSW